MSKEKQNVECKASWHDEYLKWICAFANAQGGRLVIGQNDSGEVIGLIDAEQLMEDLPNKIRDLLGIMVEFKGEVPDADALSENKASTTQETSVKTSVKILLAVEENQNVTIPELAEITGVTTRSVERNIKKLQEAGKLRRVGPDKGGHWEVIETREQNEGEI